jgi:uncharacterized protein
MLALRPLFRGLIPSSQPIRQLSVSSSKFVRTMATGTAPLQEWLVIIPDFAGALEKRMAARPKHLEGLKSDRDDMWLWGGAFWPCGLEVVVCVMEQTDADLGAMLEEPVKEGDAGPPKMKGSAMLIGAKTKEEVIERVKKDIYVAQGVWDVEKVEIIPFRSALRKAL